MLQKNTPAVWAVPGPCRPSWLVYDLTLPFTYFIKILYKKFVLPKSRTCIFSWKHNDARHPMGIDSDRFSRKYSRGHNLMGTSAFLAISFTLTNICLKIFQHKRNGARRKSRKAKERLPSSIRGNWSFTELIRKPRFVSLIQSCALKRNLQVLMVFWVGRLGKFEMVATRAICSLDLGFSNPKTLRIKFQTQEAPLRV